LPTRLLEEIPAGRTKFACWAISRRSLLIGEAALEGAAMWDDLIDCPYHHFMYDVPTGENYFPKNDYSQSHPRLQEQVRSFRTYPVELRENGVWVDLA
jgi:nitrite reductase/ring-hydroxylating ferredoxin subunit